MKTKYFIRATLAGALALLAFGPATAIAGDRGVGQVGTPSSSSADDVGSAPRLSSPPAVPNTGFVLRGRGNVILQAVLSARGRGVIEISPSTNGTYTAEFKGRYIISVSQKDVAAGKLQFDYVGSRETARVVHRGSQLILIQR